MECSRYLSRRESEQGSAKRTTSRLLRQLIDPNKAVLRATPKDERDLAIAAEHGRILAFDNLTFLSDAISNALCRLATGGGFATRELFTDEGEVIFDSQRPVIHNGIAEVVTKSDMLDRAILIYLPQIDRKKRKLDRVIDRKFAEVQPRILGALLTAVSSGLKRMAEGVTLTGGLIKALDGRLTVREETPKKKNGWPQSARALGAKLKEIAPNLRRNGVEIIFGERGSRGYTITLAEKAEPREKGKDVHNVHDVHTANAGNGLDREHVSEHLESEQGEMFTAQASEAASEHVGNGFATNFRFTWRFGTRLPQKTVWRFGTLPTQETGETPCIQHRHFRRGNCDRILQSSRRNAKASGTRGMRRSTTPLPCLFGGEVAPCFCFSICLRAGFLRIPAADTCDCGAYRAGVRIGSIGAGFA